MKVVWMGQSGLLFVSGKDKIIIDPYLTNDMQKEDRSHRRAMKINKKFFRVNPNIIILTSSAPDHTDIGTLTRYIYKSKNIITIICCAKAYEVIKEADMPRRYNIVVFEEGSEWTFKDINITAVKSKSNDISGFGVLLTDATDEKKYYIASATRYNKCIFEDLPSDIDTAFIPINGFSGAMNIYDAKRFAEKIGAKHVVPVHYGMFDSIDPKDFDVPNKIIPQIYKVINLEEGEGKKENSLDKKFNEALPDKKETKEATRNANGEKIVELPPAKKEEKDKDKDKETEKKPVIEDHKPEKSDTGLEILPKSETKNEDISDTFSPEAKAQEKTTLDKPEESEEFFDTFSPEIKPEVNASLSKDVPMPEKSKPKISFETYETPIFEETSEGVVKVEAKPILQKDTEETEEEIAKKLDAYMEEIEKFQRGDTADFSKIDF